MSGFIRRLQTTTIQQQQQQEQQQQRENMTVSDWKQKNKGTEPIESGCNSIKIFSLKKTKTLQVNFSSRSPWENT